MANYSTNLKSWGAAGSEYPDGYNYIADEPPVDAFDNYLTDNLISDIQHLTSLTNDRIESDKGTTRPSSPESAHVFADTGSGELEWYDTTTTSWSRALDATGGTMDGSLSITSGINGNGSSIAVGDALSLNGGDLTDGAGNVVYDQSANHLEQSRLENDSITATAGDGLKGGGSTALGGSFTFNVEPLDFAGAGLTDDGSDNLALNADTITVAGNSVSLGGSTGIALGDLSNVTASGEGSGNGLDADTVDGYDIQKNGSDGSGVINFKT